MKKVTKSLIAAACIATLSAGAIAMTACGGESSKKGEAYGLVHSAGYVGYSTVTLKGDKVEDVTLTEVCLPTHVTAGESVAADDKVTATILDHGTIKQADYYKTISFGSVTFTYDVTLNGTDENAVSKGYMNGTQTLVDYLKTEANAKAYYEAVVGNNFIVKIGTTDKKDIITKAKLFKDENGYWATANGSKLTPVEGKTFWQLNRDATVKYAKENGIESLSTLTRDSETNYWMNGTVSSGATWTDLNSKKDGTLSYAQIITNAYNNAK